MPAPEKDQKPKTTPSHENDEKINTWRELFAQATADDRFLAYKDKNLYELFINASTAATNKNASTKLDKNLFVRIFDKMKVKSTTTTDAIFPKTLNKFFLDKYKDQMLALFDSISPNDFTKHGIGDLAMYVLSREKENVLMGKIQMILNSFMRDLGEEKFFDQFGDKADEARQNTKFLDALSGAMLFKLFNLFVEKQSNELQKPLDDLYNKQDKLREQIAAQKDLRDKITGLAKRIQEIEEKLKEIEKKPTATKKVQAMVLSREKARLVREQNELNLTPEKKKMDALDREKEQLVKEIEEERNGSSQQKILLLRDKQTPLSKFVVFQKLLRTRWEKAVLPFTKAEASSDIKHSSTYLANHRMQQTKPEREWVTRPQATEPTAAPKEAAPKEAAPKESPKKAWVKGTSPEPRNKEKPSETPSPASPTSGSRRMR